MAYKEEDFLQFSGLQHFRFCRWQWALIHVENQLAENGNVLLRRMQYRAADDSVQSCQIARLMIFVKLYNARWSIERTRRSHAMRKNSGQRRKQSGDYSLRLSRHPRRSPCVG